MLNIVLAILVVGVVWALIDRFIPLPPVVNTVLTVLFIVIICVLLLQFAGINVGRGLRL